MNGAKRQAGERPKRSEPGGRTGFGDKTVWDWLQLLIVPVILSLISVAFAWYQNDQQQAIEAERARSDRNVEEQRAQDAALQAYLDKMSELMLQRSLLKSGEGDTAFTLAQARTTTVIERFDAKHNRSVARFLTDAGLTGADDAGPSLLAGADLRGAEFANAPLQGANFVEPQQEGSSLVRIVADPGDYVSAPGADVDVTTILSDADLSDAGLQGANLSGCQLIGTVLRDASLIDTDLTGAILRRVDLRGATLTEADLSGADLSDADLEDAEGISHQELKLQAPTLEGATMPNGKKYGDWADDPWEYATEKFQPAFRFKVEGEWLFNSPETADSLVIEDPENGQISFAHPKEYFDPQALSQSKLSETWSAADWVSWFRRHPNLDTTKPVPVNFGGAAGNRIDLTYASTAGDYPRDICGAEPCVPLYKGSEGSTNVSVERNTDRLFVLSIRGETVIIDASAPPDEFARFVPKSQEMLRSVEWEDVGVRGGGA